MLPLVMCLVYCINIMCFFLDSVFPRDCQEWKDLGLTESDIYPINPDDGEPFQVCLMFTSCLYSNLIGVL